jgi:hypothetical protein
MSLYEHARLTRLAWEAGERQVGLDEAQALSLALRVMLREVENGVCDGDEHYQHLMERITPQLCALAERIAAVRA